MYKRDIINFLFVASFPVLGIGYYISGGFSPSLGNVFGVIPYILIIVFYAMDSLYKRSLGLKLNSRYFLFLAFLITTTISYYISVHKNFPYFSSALAVGKTLISLLPFHAFIVVNRYNERKDIPRLLLLGLSILILINVVGFFGLGLQNAVHSIEGRINFPFLDSFYSGSGTLCVINLMLFYLIKKNYHEPLKMTGLVFYFIINLAIIFFINSRLMILLFLVIFFLLLFNIGIRSKIIFLISIFTLPILLNGTKVIYDILSLPVFSAVLQRVDMQDVMTFNGRSFLWQNALDWLFDDQTGLFFGNGYRGHYFLRLIDDEMKIWQVKPYNSHLHSMALWVLVDQGLLGYILLVLICFTLFKYYRSEFGDKSDLAIFYPVVIYMIFITQFDTFGYLDNVGGIILGLLFSMTVVESDNSKNNLSSVNRNA